MKRQIGARIREIRKEKGVTQTHIKKVMGKYTAWLSNIEKGKQEITALELKQLAIILGVSIDYIFLPLDFTESEVGEKAEGQGDAANCL